MFAPELVGLSRIASDFKRLDAKRRRFGLSLTEANRYYVLFARLSEALEQGERDRKVDVRQFLRVPFAMEMVLESPEGTFHCDDFGGGGCAVRSDTPLGKVGDLVEIEAALVDGERMPLNAKARIVWIRPGSKTGKNKMPQFGLGFELESDDVRDQVDRILYRVLDHFLQMPKQQHMMEMAEEKQTRRSRAH